MLLSQRPYVWEEETNWEPLWEPIRAMSERRLLKHVRRPHFLGAIVLDQLATGTGKLHRRQVIDGQQRLTTLQLALAAARDLCLAANQSRYAQSFQNLTTNDNPLSDDNDELFKVWPTNADREQYRKVMTANTITGVEQLTNGGGSGRLIPGAYVYFYRSFEEWLGPVQEPQFKERLDSLHSAIREDLHVVAIDLEVDDDAQEIFETLNNLDTPLLTADLVKNYLFRRALVQGANVEQLNNQIWSTYDEDKSYWREPVRQGRLKRPRVDLFMHHFLTLMVRDDVVATQLFSSFQDFAEAAPPRSAAEVMKTFRSYSDVYRGFDEWPERSREKLFFYRLEQLDTQTIYPLLLEVFKRFSGPHYAAERQQVIVDLESYFVRRAICRLTAKNYNKLVIEAIKHLRQTDDFSPNAIRSFLVNQSADTSRWPDDEELHKEWRQVELYKRVKRATVRMILEAIGVHNADYRGSPVSRRWRRAQEHVRQVRYRRLS